MCKSNEGLAEPQRNVVCFQFCGVGVVPVTTCHLHNLVNLVVLVAVVVRLVTGLAP